MMGEFLICWKGENYEDRQPALFPASFNSAAHHHSGSHSPVDPALLLPVPFLCRHWHPLSWMRCYPRSISSSPSGFCPRLEGQSLCLFSGHLCCRILFLPFVGAHLSL